MVRQNVGTAGHYGDQLLASCPNPAKPVPHEHDKGYVCTLSALVLRSTTAHIFHVGDSRIYRVAGKALEQLTEDHRVIVSSEQSYLGRALGINQQVEIDYQAYRSKKAMSLFWRPTAFTNTSTAHFIAEASIAVPKIWTVPRSAIGEEAFRHGSRDNLTVQIVRVDGLADTEASDIVGQAADLPCPPILETRMIFDGYQIVREIHASSRSHIYLAIDSDRRRDSRTQNPVDRSSRRPSLSSAISGWKNGWPGASIARTC